MHVLHACCCGLDVHKRFVVACLIWHTEDGKQHKEIRRFDTLTPDLLRLIDWLQSVPCTHVALESTGVYTPVASIATCVHPCSLSQSRISKRLWVIVK
jgi:transposase